MNYTIDPSVCALPDIEAFSTEEKIGVCKAFVDNLAYLQFIITNTSVRNIKLFVFKKYLKAYFNRNTFQYLNELFKMNNEDNYCRKTGGLVAFWEDLPNRILQSKKLYYLEDYMGINPVNLCNNALCDPETGSLTENREDAKRLKRNIVLLAFLNQYIYKDHSVNPLLTDFQITGDVFKTAVKQGAAEHSFSEAPKQAITFENTMVENKYFAAARRHIRRVFSTAQEAIIAAGENFGAALVFDTAAILEQIKEYEEGIGETKKSPSVTKDDLETIRRHEKEYPNTIYDHLDALDKLVKFIGKSEKNISLGNRPYIFADAFFECESPEVPKKYKYPRWCSGHPHEHECTLRNKCPVYLFKCGSTGIYPVCYKCRGFLRLCGYQCSDEDPKTKENAAARKQREQEDGTISWLHLKPYSWHETHPLAPLTLRIHFQLADNKIKIDYIGPHLFVARV
jgi:hypothetical protein